MMDDPLINSYDDFLKVEQEAYDRMLVAIIMSMEAGHEPLRQYVNEVHDCALRLAKFSKTPLDYLAELLDHPDQKVIAAVEENVSKRSLTDWVLGL